MKPTLAKDIVLDAILIAVWRRRPNEPVIIHSDQGSQYSSGDWQRFCQKHNLVTSMSRRGNCWDNAVAESFLAAWRRKELKRESIKLEKWPVQMCLIISRCFTIESGIIRISMGWVQKPLRQLQNEAVSCIGYWEQNLNDLCSLAMHRNKLFGFDKSSFLQGYWEELDSTGLRLKFAINVPYAHCHQQMGV